MPYLASRYLLIQPGVPRGSVVVFLGSAKPKSVVQFLLTLHAVKEPFGLEPLEVGQVAQGGEAERLQECPRRHVSERGAGLRGADVAVDEPVATWTRS